MDHTTHTPGSFCIAMLRTRDIERATAFYGALVGWTAHDVPGNPGHRLLQSGGRTVAALCHADDDSDRWVPYVSVDDAARTTADAIALGATLVDTADVLGLARLATLRDPEGALFGLWQPAPHQGAQRTEDAGSLWWVEVLANDVAGARAFYGGLFGWTSADRSLEPIGAYTMFMRGAVQEGGVLPIGPDWDVSPRWNAIFAVEDCDATIARAQRLGGSTLFVHTVPKAGRVGSFYDTGGAVFVVRGPVP